MNQAATLIIPVHNRRELTLQCLAALHAQADTTRCKVTVVDDGSTDGTGAAIQAEFPQVEVLRGDGTLFWTGAVALAMTRQLQAQATGPVLWLNDDCRPKPGALAALLAWLETNPETLAGPTCIDPESSERVRTGFVGRTTIVAAPGEVREVDGLSGFCVGIGANAWPKLGAPDARRFPHYAGDTAYTLRAHQQGRRCVLLGDAEVELIGYRPPRSIAESIDPAETLRRNWQRIFAETRSPHRLRTMAALLRLKYGPLTGTLLAALRSGTWAAQLLAAYRRAR